MVLYCTMRARAQTEKERHEIEEEMRNTPAGSAILDELLGDTGNTNVSRLITLITIVIIF